MYFPFLLLMLVLLNSCAGFSTRSDIGVPSVPSVPISLGVDASPVFEGRWSHQGNMYGTINQGSSFKIGTYGATSVFVDVEVGKYVTLAPRLAVSVDGGPPSFLTAHTGHEYLVTQLTPVQHTLIVTVSGIHELDQNWHQGPAIFIGKAHVSSGYLITTLPSARHFLFIGDSITAGAYAKGAVDGPMPENSAAESSYATLTARAFDAEPIIDAFSGTGVDLVGSGDAPGALERVSFDASGQSNIQIHPDLILVNLGTNDYAHFISDVEFIRQYKELLKRLAYTYPTAKIVILQPFNGVYKLVLTDLAHQQNVLYFDTMSEAEETVDGTHLSINGHLNVSRRINRMIVSEHMFLDTSN